MPRKWRIFYPNNCNIFLVSSIFKCNPGKTNDKFKFSDIISSSKGKESDELLYTIYSVTRYGPRASCQRKWLRNSIRSPLLALYFEKFLLSLAVRKISHSRHFRTSGTSYIVSNLEDLTPPFENVLRPAAGARSSLRSKMSPGNSSHPLSSPRQRNPPREPFSSQRSIFGHPSALSAVCFDRAAQQFRTVARQQTRVQRRTVNLRFPSSRGDTSFFVGEESANEESTRDNFLRGGTNSHAGCFNNELRNNQIARITLAADCWIKARSCKYSILSFWLSTRLQQTSVPSRTRRSGVATFFYSTCQLFSQVSFDVRH